MSDVVLTDGRHAWVCHSIEHIFMREAKIVWDDPRKEELLQLIFGKRPDAVGDEIDVAYRAALTDVEKLKHCLRYAHHVYGRKRGNEPVNAIVAKALNLPGGQPAKSVNYAGGKYR
jgi:hypothetical protein